MTYPMIAAPPIGLPPDEARVRVRSYLDTMRSRRTIRDFSPEPVPFELIETAVRAAATGPSGANIQP